jgi:prevent-host-death family protein
MATPVSQRELRNDSGAIMRRVQQGERFTVTRNGVPVADLVPHSESGPDRPPRFIPVAQIATGASELPSWDTARFMHELEELDHAVDDSDADRWRAAT